MQKQTDGQRVAEIYQEIFGKFDASLVDENLPYNYMDESEIYAVFSESRYGDLKRQQFYQEWKNKPIITDYDRVRQLAQEVLGDDSNIDPEYFSKKSEEEIRQELLSFQKSIQGFKTFGKEFKQ